MIEIEIKESKKKKNPYPCLKEYNDGTIVLFTSYKTGTCITSPETQRIGEYREDWIEEYFFESTKVITLKNHE